MSSKFLKSPTVPIGSGKGKPASKILEEMLSTGFQGRRLAECFYLWKKMLQEEKITIWLGISGAIVPAGMRKLMAYLIQKRMVDVVVSTGAQLFHDACEAWGVQHFQGSAFADDVELCREKVDRFHDIYVKEDLQREIDKKIQIFIETLKDNYQYSSREFLYLLGKHLDETAKEKDSILIQAAKANIPVYAPALCDSSIGYSFVMARKEGNFRYVDQMKDTDETAQIANASSKSGVIYLGGGVPKNFIQQAELLNLIMGHEPERFMAGHDYAIQITTDNPHFGGLSGCTFEEAQSWGKIAKEAKKVQCFCDLTIALPFLVNALADYEELAVQRKKPSFDWGNPKQIKIKYA